MATLKALAVIHLGPKPAQIVQPGQLFVVKDEQLAQSLIEQRHASEHESDDEVKVVEAESDAAQATPAKKGGKARPSDTDL